MRWHLCTIGQAAPANWDLCKQVGLYGIPGSRFGRPRAETGDHLLVWQGGAGYIAEAAVTGPARIPNSKKEAPWPGGIYRFEYVIPIEVVLEVKSPLKFPFVGNEQSGTSFPKGKFQRSFAPIDDEAAMYVSAALRERRAEETQGNKGA